jgi:hypothetical protein
MNRFEQARAQGRYWREVLASGGHGLWQGEPKTDRELAFHDAVVHAAEAEERETVLARVLLQEVRQGRVNVQGTSEPAPVKAGNKRGRRNKDSERLTLMEKLLAKHGGDENRASAEYVETLSSPCTSWAHTWGVVTSGHAGKSWRTLRPKLGQRLKT